MEDDEAIKWKIIRDQKISKELAKIKQKQLNQLKILLNKSTQGQLALNKKRALAFDKLVQKYKNQTRDLEIEMKSEKMNYTKLKDSSRIMNEVSFISSKIFIFKD